MNVKPALARTAAPVLAALALHAPADAAGEVPEVSPTLKKMLEALPVDGLKDQVHGMVGALKKTACGGGLAGCYAVKQGDVQLYFLTDGKEQQTFLLVLDRRMALPTLLKPNVQKILGGTSLQDPIISISTSDFWLDTAKMPSDLQAVMAKAYWNVPSLLLATGVQIEARATLAGVMKDTMKAMGVNADALAMRSGVSIPIPTDLASGAGTGAGLAQALRDGQKMQDAAADALKPGAYVEFQLGPGAVVKMGSPMPAEILTDATFFLDNELVFGFKGNAYFGGAVTGDPFLMQFQTPLSPEGAADLLDFSMRMATPHRFGLADTMTLLNAMASPDPRLAKYGGGYVRNISSYARALQGAVASLAAFQEANPNPAPAYRFGDRTKPFPTDPKYFNLVIYGPLAQGGPYMHAADTTVILGEPFATMDITAGTSGFHASATQDLTLKLGPLGRVKIEKVAASVDIDAKSQSLRLNGNFGGQPVQVGINGANATINVPATCANPFEIKASASVNASTNLDDIFNAQGGANVDPSSIAGCVGKQLEDALRKISGDYKSLGGYSAADASRQLARVLNADGTYKATKDAARNIASRGTSSAAKAFNDAGNAFRKLGGKKHKHSAPPDPRFHESVFDWDDYYDNAPDVVAAGVDLASHWSTYGFNEGRQGSSEFQASYYWDRYADVQALCPGRNLQCAVQHWVSVGIDEGRQGSAQFAVADYLKRYPDLQQAFGQNGWADAMDHWINNGQDEGRDGHPDATVAGPLNGPVLIGGGGGNPWSDDDACQGQPVTGFRVQAGNNVDGVQFQYGGSRWGAVHGVGNRWSYEIAFQPGEYVVRVDYRADGGMTHAVGFVTNMGHGYGMFGGSGGTYAAFYPTPGQFLGCMSGRAGSSVDRMIFASTGPR